MEAGKSAEILKVPEGEIDESELVLDRGGLEFGVSRPEHGQDVRQRRLV